MRVRILAKPGKSKSELAEPSEFERKKCDFVAIVRSPPVEGKANREIGSLLEERFGGRAVIVSGSKAKLKVFEVLL